MDGLFPEAVGRYFMRLRLEQEIRERSWVERAGTGATAKPNDKGHELSGAFPLHGVEHLLRLRRELVERDDGC
jgi:hypothetical protein